MTESTIVSFLASRTGRTRLLMLFFACWGTVICGRLGQVMIIQRERYIAEMSRESWREGTIPPLRGRILDRNGTPLAWSTRHFALLYQVPDKTELLEKDLADLSRLIPGLKLPAARIQTALPNSDIKLKSNLTPEEAESLSAACRQLPRLRLGSYFFRHYHKDPQARQRLGQTEAFKGLVIGISGEEKQQDHLLRGCPGKFRVMVDRNGNWLPQTWQKVRELRPGYDVYLPFTVNHERGR